MSAAATWHEAGPAMAEAAGMTEAARVEAGIEVAGAIGAAREVPGTVRSVEVPGEVAIAEAIVEAMIEEPPMMVVEKEEAAIGVGIGVGVVRIPVAIGAAGIVVAGAPI